MTGPLVIITSRGHLPRMRAHKILLKHGYEHFHIVVDNRSQAIDVVNSGVPPDKVTFTDCQSDLPNLVGIRIAWTREWVEQYIVPRGHWYVTLDDNVSGWTWLPPPYYNDTNIDFGAQKPADGRTWRELYNTPCPFPQVVKLWEEMIDHCGHLETEAGGFAVENNFFYRSRKWQYFGYVRAQNAVWKNTGRRFFRWDPTPLDAEPMYGAGIEDFVRSVDLVVNCGQVLINRFVKPHKPEFEEGGIGTFEQRRPRLVELNQQLMRRYPGLLREVKDHDYQLTFATRNIEKWKREHAESLKG